MTALPSASKRAIEGLDLTRPARRAQHMGWNALPGALRFAALTRIIAPWAANGVWRPHSRHRLSNASGLSINNSSWPEEGGGQ